MLSLHVNQTTEYALRAMSVLAQQYRKEPMSAKALSKETEIPQGYLSKIMKHMVDAKLVISQKGHGGGFVLAKAPSKIRFSDIMLASGYKSSHPKRCVFGWGVCDSNVPCPLHDSWSELNNDFKKWALKKTLNDIPKG
jgi:Rrf2 family transcriptional regulator, iron-sulfur cluster assembly transcription factor